MPDESSPCQMAAADAAYMGYLPKSDVHDALNELLEAERAGAAAVLHVAQSLDDDLASLRQKVVRIGRDEGRFCRMLLTEIRRLDRPASTATGNFLSKVEALSGFGEKLGLLIKGQAWVVRRLDELLPRIRDEKLHEKLREMRNVHVVNVNACEDVLDTYLTCVGRK